MIPGVEQKGGGEVLQYIIKIYTIQIYKGKKLAYVPIDFFQH
jgi:hypothetical protein